MQIIKSWVVLFALVATPLAPLQVAAQSADVPTLAPMLKVVTPGVVNIAVQGRSEASNPLLNDPFFRRYFGRLQPRQQEVRATGSGVIVDVARGYVLTNNHVVENAQEIEVTTKDNRRYKAQLVGRDPGTDIAVLRIQGAGLTAVPLGDSDVLEVGDYVVAIGNPFGLGQTATLGIVSALGRSGLDIEGYEDFIQTDASINPGNSGGALVDLRGRLIGINTAILAPSGGNVGIGFAVPINMARLVMNQIVEHGEIRRGRIGIGVQDLTPDLARSLNVAAENGVVVGQVEPGSPAARAGMRPGDLIVAIDDAPVRSSTQVRNRIGLKRIGDPVDFVVVQNGQRRTVRARVERAPG